MTDDLREKMVDDAIKQTARPYRPFTSAREEAIECIRILAEDMRATANRMATERGLDNRMLVAEALKQIADEAEAADSE